MKLYRAFEIKWYHLLFGLLALIGVVFLIGWLFISNRRPGDLLEDETDIVA